MNPRPYRIGIVAGEASGDILGAGLVEALRTYYPNAVFEGIAGPRMIAQGCISLWPMETLSVMGYWDVIKRLPSLLKTRRQLITHFLSHPPDIFIGIDAPDFNLGVELKLRQSGIRTVHYNSPTIWAWRPERIHQIKKAVDLMLTLFPFEPPLYEAEQIPVCFVGHPLADLIPLQTDQISARIQLDLPQNTPIIALLPGSRSNEIQSLGKLFLETALWCQQHKPELQFIAPMANQARLDQFQKLQQEIAPQLPIKLILGQSHPSMAASDVVLLASGTATLEALLLKRPMVVAYRTSALNAWIAKKRILISQFSLPNILADKTLIPEFIQTEAMPEKIGPAILERLSHPQENLIREYNAIHRLLRQNANQKAAEAIATLLDSAPQGADNSTF